MGPEVKSDSNESDSVWFIFIFFSLRLFVLWWHSFLFGIRTCGDLEKAAEERERPCSVKEQG